MVEQEALQSIAWRDAHEPGHYLATRAAHHHNQRPLWRTLADQAHTLATVLERCYELKKDQWAQRD